MTDDELLGAVRSFTKALGHPPTHAELAVKLGVSESAVRKRLARLRAEGRVDWRPGARRTLHVPGGKGRSWPMS